MLFKKNWSDRFGIVGLMIVISIGVFLLVSLNTEQDKSKSIEQYMYQPEMINEGFENVVWYKHYVTHLIILTMLILGILTWLW